MLDTVSLACFFFCCCMSQQDDDTCDPLRNSYICILDFEECKARGVLPTGRLLPVSLSLCVHAMVHFVYSASPKDGKADGTHGPCLSQAKKQAFNSGLNIWSCTLDGELKLNGTLTLGALWYLAGRRHVEDRFRLLWHFAVSECYSFYYCYISTSAPPCPQPAGPDYARWSPRDVQQTQPTSKHSLSSPTHSNHKADGQALLHPRRLHFPGKTAGCKWVYWWDQQTFLHNGSSHQFLYMFIISFIWNLTWMHLGWINLVNGDRIQKKVIPKIFL